MPFLANLHGKIYITWSPLLHLSWYDHPSHVCVTRMINVHSLCQLHPPKVSYHVSNFMQHCSPIPFSFFCLSLANQFLTASLSIPTRLTISCIFLELGMQLQVNPFVKFLLTYSLIKVSASLVYFAAATLY